MCRPEWVVLAETHEVAGCVTAGGEGIGGGGGCVSGLGSRYAGLRRSRKTLSLWPLSFICLAKYIL